MLFKFLGNPWDEMVLCFSLDESWNTLSDLFKITQVVSSKAENGKQVFWLH